MMLAIAGWRHTVREKEIAMESGGRFETDGESNLIHRHVGFSQQSCGFLQTEVAQVFAKSLIIRLFEFIGKSRTVGTHRPTDILARQLLIAEEIVTVHDLIQLPAKIAVLICGIGCLFWYIRGLRDTLDRQAENNPSDSRDNQIYGVCPLCKTEEGTKNKRTNNGDECAGSGSNH